MSSFDGGELRRRAEEQYRCDALDRLENFDTLAPEERGRIVHELRVHQIELEMQNEELRRAQAELDTARARYFELYDLAPVGYCTVSEEGLILEANLTASTLLGMARGRLVGQAYSRFIWKDDQDCYYQNRKALFASAKPRASEVRMAKADGTMFWARMEANIAPDADGKPVAHIVLSDITARKLAEQALAASRAELQAIHDHTPVMMCVLNRDRQVLYANPAFTSFTGIPEGELKGGRACGVFGCINALDDPRGCGYGQDCGDCTLRLALEDTLKTGEIHHNFEHRASLVRDGVVRDVVLLASTAVIQTAGAKRVMLCLNDITASKQAEEDYQTLFREMLNGFVLHEIVRDWEGLPADFRFLAVNPAFEQMTGIRAADIVGKTITELELEVSPEGMRAYDEVALSGEPSHFEYYDTTRQKHFEVMAFRPAAERCACIFADVTDRRRAEMSLQASEARYRSILEASPDDITITDMDGRVVQVSPATLPMFRCQSEEEIVGHLVTDFIVPEDRARAAGRMASMQAGGGIVPTEYRALRPDGSTFDMEVNGQFIRNVDGQPTNMVFVVRDVTERKALEAQLRQAQKMESIGRLAGGVAHDFNNLLTVINGYSEILLADLQVGDPMHRALTEIQKAGARAAGLTRQLLGFSRKQLLEPHRLDVNEVVEKIRPMLERLLLGESVDVEVALGAEDGTVWADANQLEQVIVNLAVNARDAMPGGGKLRIETSMVDLDEEFVRAHLEAHAGRYVLLTVSDNGTGMDEATQQRIFEPFFTTKEVGKGTGLGLSMAQGVVIQSGGCLTVESQVGHGTTFRIYLPAVTEAAVVTPVAPLASPRGRERVLVVEDQPGVRRYAVAVLQAHGYEVLEAGNGAAALRLCDGDGGRIDLLVTDVLMPNLSGRELAEQLMVLRPELKVLYMSGYSGSLLTDRGGLAEDAHFLAKPFSPAEFARKVHGVLGEKG